ncbi:MULTISPECIES: DUF1259 domain-containing protein [Streptomyces]|uniref:DUF1259 domain-containing protein n=1 Tax=Streptomyces celluloflavus TaxID=58344 RepID=A0ABW7R658_9ACTN|nr:MULTISPECIES: DUF1259 domain-containing protein [Streptomyces]MYU51519.1 DUF1259 domain-containing protein [Streptomyces sp. SID7805]WSK16450.1 DUF1259 domain-containing protein [Streptomyces celluloflavus]
MSRGQQEDRRAGALLQRRRLLAGAVLVPVLAGAGVAAACSGSTALSEPVKGKPAKPVPTAETDWQDVAKTLGRAGTLIRGEYHHTAFPRGDLHVVSQGVIVRPALALGSHVSFVRYSDGMTMAMGDLVVTECELQSLSDAVHAQGFTQTAIHKHLLAQNPDIWWTHIHGHGPDPVALARGVRTILDHTDTPPPARQSAPVPLELDTDGIDAALGAKGTSDGGVHSCIFVRRETITDGGRVLPSGLGATTSFTFQPLGNGRAALNGDFAMVAGEVQNVLKALRRGGIDLVELHNHGLTDEPRLFFTHFWAVDDAVKLARALRAAVDATNNAPATDGVA